KIQSLFAFRRRLSESVPAGRAYPAALALFAASKRTPIRAAVSRRQPRRVKSGLSRQCLGHFDLLKLKKCRHTADSGRKRFRKERLAAGQKRPHETEPLGCLRSISWCARAAWPLCRRARCP